MFIGSRLRSFAKRYRSGPFQSFLDSSVRRLCLAVLCRTKTGKDPFSSSISFQTGIKILAPFYHYRHSGPDHIGRPLSNPSGLRARPLSDMASHRKPAFPIALDRPGSASGRLHARQSLDCRHRFRTVQLSFVRPPARQPQPDSLSYYLPKFFYVLPDQLKQKPMDYPFFTGGVPDEQASVILTMPVKVVNTSVLRIRNEIRTFLKNHPSPQQ